jgi:acetyl esterase
MLVIFRVFRGNPSEEKHSTKRTRSMKNPFTTLLVALSIALGCHAAPAPQPDQVVVYKTTPQAELKLHIFNLPGHQPGDHTPAIVFFHGGGWQQGGSSQFFWQSRYLADRGMVAISADYRVFHCG